MTTALTLNSNQDVASLATAAKMVATQAGTTSNGVTTKIGTATGWGEIFSQGSTAAWPALGAIGAPSGHGWLLDDTSLEFQQIVAGNWQWIEKARVSTGTATIDLVVRYYKYNAGVYTLIGSITLASQAFTTTQTVYTSASTALALMNFGATGDKIYKDMWVNITTNGTGLAAATFALQTCNNVGAGLSGIAQTTTPGYQPLSPIAQTAPTTLSFSTTLGTNPASQNSTFSNVGGTSSAWTSSISYGSGSGWLAISPTSGTLGAGAGVAVAFTCTAGSLPVGTYTATVTFTMTTGGSTATVTVTFVVAYPPGLSVLISSNPVNLEYASWKLVKQIDQQDRCVITILDTTGTGNYTKFQPVQINDSIQGIIWTGYINDPVSSKLPGNAHRMWVIDCLDQILVGHNRTSNRTYANQYGGTIFADQIQRYLASEGVSGAFALRWDEAQTDFAAGTLTNAVATNNFYDANSGDGDLELSKIGTDVTYSDAGLISSTTKCLKLQGTCVSGVANAYVYRKIWSGSQLIASGDSLEYDIWISSTSPQIIAGVDFVCTDGTTFRDSPNAGTDAQGILPHPKYDLAGLANDTWYHRGFGVSGSLIGKTISYVTVVLEGDNPGTYTAFFRNVYWKNGVTTKQIFSDDSSYVMSQVSGGPPVNVTVGLNGYNNVSLIIVQAYDNIINGVTTHSIDAAKIVKGSVISWVTGNAGGTAGVATGALAKLETSIDNGATWQTPTNGGTVPNLQPGMSVAGRSLQYRRSVLLGNDPTVANYFVSEKLTVYSSYNATKSDVVSTTSTQANFNAGTLTNTKSLSGGGVTLNGVTRNYDDADYSSQTLFGNSSPFQAILNKQFYLSTFSGTDVKTRLDFAGQWQNFTAEVDVLVQANFTLGFVYRTTNWGNSNDSEAYTVVLSSTTMTFGKGNNSTGAGSNTNLIVVPTLALTAGTWHRLKIVINGTTHQAYLDDVLYINTTDVSYNFAMPNAGYIGLRMYNNSGVVQNGYFDNFGVVANLSGTWQSPAISIAAATTYGSSLVEWDTLQTPDSTFITAQTSINGGSTWQDVTNGGAISGLVAGAALAGVNVLIKFTLTANNAPVQPTLGAFTIWVLGQFSASGTRISPVLALTAVGRAGSSLVNWNALQPASTSVLVDTSIDNQVSWQNVAAPGNAITGINLQPQPTIDAFAANSSANYTSSAWGGAGVAGTWTWDVANRRIVGNGGTNAANLLNGLSCVDGIVIFDLDYADSDAGIAFRWTDTTHQYQLRVNDASSGSSPNTAKLFVKNGAGAPTQVGSTATISFIRGNKYRFKLDVQGTAFTVYLDDVQIISTTDATLSATGSVALLAGAKIQCYQLRVQPYGDDVTAKTLYTRVRLNSTDPTATPALLDLQAFVSGPSIGAGVLIPSRDYRLTYVSDNLQDQSTQSNYWWNFDLNKKAQFQPRNATPAPWVLATVNASVQSAGQKIGDVLIDSLSVRNSADLYRNRQVLKGVQATQIFSRNFVGDGSSTSWTLDYAVAPGTTPTFKLNGQAVTIGVQGVDVGKNFYYTPGGTGITQDVSGTVLQLNADTLSVSYTGIFTTSVTRNNTGGFPGTVSQSQLQAIMGSGTGIVENVLDVTAMNLNVAGANAYGDQLLQLYGVMGMILTHKTLRQGLAPGQQLPVFIPEKQIINAQFLIQSVEITATYSPDGNNVQYWYNITAITGPNLGNWIRLFANGLKQ